MSLPAATRAPEVRVLGIRHHGPGSARAVLRELARFEPDTVLIEGPADADPLALSAGAADMRPPVALLAYAAATPSTAAFWPFAAFSPEWQALQWALLHDADVRFCDLPAALTLAADRTPDRDEEDLLGALARAGGFDDFEQWWDAVVESRASGPTRDETTGHSDGAEFTAISEAMAALREEIVLDEHTLRREAHMRQVLRATVKAGAVRVAVVCGALHAPALTGPLGPAAPDARLLKGMPKIKTAITWVPWSHSRLASVSGYGAGVTSPGWYDHLFRDRHDTVARWFTKVARTLRDKDLPVSSAHVIEATRLAETLAALRDRPLPGLAEVTEATRAVLCDGDDVLLEFVTRTLVVGEQLGQVPADTPTVPLDADLQAQSRTLRLKRSAGVKKLDLDLRKDFDLRRSRLLHRLRLLGIEWGLPADDEIRSTGTFRESWTLQWEPELSVALIEAARWGTTVESATHALVAERAGSPGLSLGAAVDLLEQALLADLRDTVRDLLRAVDAAAALDHDVVHLMAVLPALTRTVRYGDVRGTDLSSLEHVTDGLLVRICAGLDAAATGLDADAADGLRAAVDGVHGALALRDHRPSTERWLGALQGLVDRRDVDGLVVGRAVRLLRDAGRFDEAETAVRLSAALSVGAAPAVKARWVDGFVGGGGILLVHDRSLLRVIDRWVTELRGDEFVDVLPVLRRTFGSYAPGERATLGSVIRNGDRGAGPPAAIDEERGRRAVRTVAFVLGVAG